MKTTLLAFVFVLINFAVFAQARLGSSEKDIRQEFNSKTFSSGYTDKGDRYISYEDTDVFVLYYFDENNICDYCVVKPQTRGLLNTYVERYNNQYVIVSNKDWKMYNDNGILCISLVFSKEFGTYFKYYACD